MVEVDGEPFEVDVWSDHAWSAIADGWEEPYKPAPELAEKVAKG